MEDQKVERKDVLIKLPPLKMGVKPKKDNEGGDING